MLTFKKYLVSLLALVIIFCITFIFFHLCTGDSLYTTIIFSIGFSLMLLANSLGKEDTNFDKKSRLNILIFLSIISIIIITIVSVIFKNELINTIVTCIGLPIVAFSAYYVSKRFMRDKRKTRKNVE
jgi:peptidoglycan/LPS O-acetylase OafA/YrhL